MLIGEASHGTGACACRPAACTLHAACSPELSCRVGYTHALQRPHLPLAACEYSADSLPDVYLRAWPAEDFYRMRAELTKLLIAERGFNAGALLCLQLFL